MDRAISRKTKIVFNWGTPLEILCEITKSSMYFGDPDSAYYNARNLFHSFFRVNPHWRDNG